MSKIVWDLQRDYEAGCNKAVLYQSEGGEYLHGVAWDGITSVSSNIEGGEITPLYSGNRRIGNAASPDEYGISVKCYSYPEEFEPCIGETEVAPGMVVNQQDRQTFGLSYQTRNGTAFDPDAGYTIHMIYGCTVSSFDYEYSTLNENTEVVEFTFDIITLPEPYEGLNALAHIKIKSLTANSQCLATLVDILYGTDEEDPRMPLPEEVAEILTAPVENSGYPDENLYPNESENPIDDQGGNVDG